MLVNIFQRPAKARKESPVYLSLYEMLGNKKIPKKALLLHFGSAQNVARAALEDLMLVPGIDKFVAKKIYQYFHEM